MLHCVYRISDSGNPKTKLENATKADCLNNFIKTFGDENLTIIADNCLETTIEQIKNRCKLIETNMGNSQSFLYAMNYSIDNFEPDDYVYLCEDDYLHRKNSKKVLLEGLKIADYVTLYDHPDKYGEYSPNPFVTDGGEISRVLLTNSTHWKTTNSTTMTFAAKVKTLSEDKDIFEKFCDGGTPLDFNIFRILTKNFMKNEDDKQTFKELKLKKRCLISSIPGYSTHCESDLLSPIVNWSKY